MGLARRPASFLDVVHDEIYANLASPYRALLAHAGCELGDIESMVRREGLDGTLRSLFRAGVYLTIDELKGTSPVRRGSLSFTATPAAFRNTRSAAHLAISSGGSTGPVRGHLLDLEALGELAVSYGLAYEAHGIEAASFGLWETVGPVATASMLYHARYFGRPPSHWFRLGGAASDARLELSSKILRWVGRPLGRRFPPPEEAHLGDPTPILRWMSDELRAGRHPTLRAFPTSAMTLAQRAREHGIDLTGARVLVAGEPLTKARFGAIRDSGLGVISLYGASECGAIGLSCVTPQQIDEVHVFDDLHAIFQLDEADETARLPVGALLMTSLRRSARLILLNVSLGDAAERVERDCRCGLASIGWNTRLHAIHSFEKLNSAGMTFRASDMTRVLEEVLPRRFGGTGRDYQLAEVEDEAGRPRVILRIHPDVGAVDEDEACGVLLDTMGSASDVSALMAGVWRDAGVVIVRREAPEATARGKVLHFQRR